MVVTRTQVDFAADALNAIVIKLFKEKDPKDYSLFYKDLQKTYDAYFDVINESDVATRSVIKQLVDKIDDLNILGTSNNTFVLDVVKYNVPRFLQAYAFTHKIVTTQDEPFVVTMSMLREIFFYLSVIFSVDPNHVKDQVDTLLTHVTQNYTQEQFDVIEKYIKNESFPLVIKMQFTKTITKIRLSKKEKTKVSVVEETKEKTTPVKNLVNKNTKKKITVVKKETTVPANDTTPIEELTSGDITLLFKIEKLISNAKTNDELLKTKEFHDVVANIKPFFDAWNKAIESGTSEVPYLTIIGRAFTPTIRSASKTVLDKYDAINVTKVKSKNLTQRVAGLEQSIDKILALLSK